jgi:hypothetical protein
LKISIFNGRSKFSAEDRNFQQKIEIFSGKNKKPRGKPKLPLKIRKFSRRWNNPGGNSKLLRNFWIFSREFQSSARKSKTSAEDLKLQRNFWNFGGSHEIPPRAARKPVKTAIFDHMLIQSPTYLVVLMEGSPQSHRLVFLDGRAHPKEPDPTWYGHAGVGQHIGVE